MTDRDKITNILKVYTKKHNISASSVILEEYAEELISNGVILPPCKVGDDIWWVDNEDKTVKCEKNGVKLIAWNGKEWLISDGDGGFDPIGTEWSCLTKEEAEAKLRELNNNGTM